ncbi:MMPL family transporter [Kineosporia sp. J2-2]|uniref:MMPL family transporter n=1 Tax=Kineosporia corallincola TaxID=2835133 RepID=A0ABS5TSE0_9ACTN|nr:MMPL family transporter [Kineosporia corallincola]MBT0773734.1 MMPL family transporter [Kineosporia corallincola]
MELFDGGTKRRLPHLVGPRLSRLVVLIAVVFSGLALAAPIAAEESGNGVANVPAGAESRQAAQVRDELGGSEVVPAIVVIDRNGQALTQDDRATVQSLVKNLERYAVAGSQTFQQVSDDGEAAVVGVPLSSSASNDELVTIVEAMRADLAGLPDGLRAQVTGGPAFTVDLAGVFDGADTRLLAFTAIVVALLLLLTYRSPWLWLVPLAVVGVADQVAVTVVAAGTKVLPFTTDGASVGITSVLVFGAGTNYALLLIARYREELRRHENRYDAMKVAVDRAAPAILASSGTVVLALLCLGFADSPSSRNIGLGGALGIVTAVLYALLVLPAAMTVPGRRLFWPFVPHVRTAGTGELDVRAGIWWRVAGAVTRRPVLVGLAGAALLAVLIIPLAGLRTGLSQTEQFRATPESVTGQETLGEHFPAGSSEPTVVVVGSDVADRAVQVLGDVEGVRSARPSADGSGRTAIDVVLDSAPASDASFRIIGEIRSTIREIDAGALVGGSDAEALDADEVAHRDRLLIIPLVLAVVLGVLLLLLRSLVAAVVLVLTVVATYAAAMGAAWVAFEHWFGFPALDLTVPLLAFLFLVALGVDYNIFLTTRAKEEAERVRSGGETADVAADIATDVARGPISVALAVTGGVITSAGVLLAAVFAVLGVLPLIVLTQIGVIVGFGVLLDTLLVRSVLVPALVTLLGRWFWWPGRLSRAADRENDRENDGAHGAGSGGLRG